MSSPNSFRLTSWKDVDKSSEDRSDIKLVLSAMKNNFDRSIKEVSDSPKPIKKESSIGKTNNSEVPVDIKSSKTKTPSGTLDLNADSKNGKKNHSSGSESSGEKKVCVKTDPVNSRSSASEVSVENKTSIKRVPVISKSNSDSLLDVKPGGKKDLSAVKNDVSEDLSEKKLSHKKDLSGIKVIGKIVEAGNNVKTDANKKKIEKKLETEVPGTVTSCNKSETIVNSSSVTAVRCKEVKSESKTMPSETHEQNELSSQQTDISDEERKKKLARKRALRNRSATRSECGSEGESPPNGPKRSARRWSKEGESVLQNAIARKEKSLSSIGKTDDERAGRVPLVRHLKDGKTAQIGKRSQSKPQDCPTPTNTENSSDAKSKSPVSSDTTSEMSKQSAKSEILETMPDASCKASSAKQDSETTCVYTKTGKRRYRPFRGLRYSFNGVTKRTKFNRRSAPSQRSVASDFLKNERSSSHILNSTTASPMKKALNGVLMDKSCNNSPALANACTSKLKKSRREDVLTPSPSPGDTLADATQPESTAISFGAGSAGLCLCQSETNFYVRKDSFVDNDVSLMCQAVDSLEGRLIGCCNAVAGTECARLYRPSPRVPYVVLCEQHRQRLLRHHCCPGCGNYCTQGRFVQCPAHHYYHRDCQLFVAGKPQCPHCGLDSPPDEVSISLGIHKYPVFLPHQKLVKQTPSARMSLGSSAVSTEPPLSPSINIAMTLPIATTVLEKGEREKLEKLMNGACSMRNEGRTAHLPRYSSKHLYQAAKSGDSEKIIAVIRHGINPNHIYREINMRTALHAAAEKGHVLAVHVLVQAGAQLDPQDGDLMTPIMYAALHGHTRIIQYLVKAGACVTHQGSDGMTALHIAAKAGQLDACHCLLTFGKAPLDFINVKDDGGWTALVWSCEFQHATVARYLLEKRADPLLRDSEHNIALHWAAFSGSEEISERLLNYGCDVNCLNIHGDTPLHVAARQDNLQCVLLFLSRGAQPDIVNKLGQQALDCAIEGGDCYNSIHTTSELRKMTKASKERTNKILSNDITRGKEDCEIQCLNAVDDESEPHNYVYVTENCFTSNIHVDRSITSLQSCQCKDTCVGSSCKCTQLSLQSWYDSEGKLLPEFNFFDPPMLFECNEMCSCNVKLCKNRVVQRGLKARFQLFRTVGKGWGVRTLNPIPKGTYVCEYIGELISDCEADQREDDSYLFDLDNRDGETYCIDACRYGNIARFINHMCAPNLQPVRVFMGHHDLHFPRIAFFANRDIQSQEELGFDYGDKFWIIKYKSFTCTCGAPNCKYSETTIKQTLADYKRKQEEEMAT